MYYLIPVVVLSLSVSFVLTPFLRDFFGFLGVMDIPDSQRKTHARPVPRVGGIALAISYSVALVVLAFGWWKGIINPHDPSIRLMAELSPAVAIIFMTGLFDDFIGLSPWRKIAGQSGAAVYACWVGVRLATPVGYTGPVILIELISVFWLLLCANAFNLIDGLDGLATGVALIAAASLLVAALVHHYTGLALMITPLIGALFGFLYYNSNPASIFLGDSGSLLVGFLLGCYGLVWSQHATTGLGKAAPLVALAFPVFEVGLSVVRRYLRIRPVFGSDRNHIHDRIQSLGLSQRKAALALYGVSGLAAILAVLQTILRPQLATVLLLLSLAVAYVGFRSLRYTEFGVLKRLLFTGEFRRILRGRIHLHEYEQSLAAAETIEQCWLVLRNTCREANFNYVSLRAGGRYFEDKLHSAPNPNGRLRIALSHSDTATFGYDPRSAGPMMLVVPLAERLQERLTKVQMTSWLTSDAERDEQLRAKSAAAG